MKPDIYQVELIGSGFLAVMAKPVAGEWIEDEFKGIANYGICQIVSLLESAEAYDVGLHDEKKLTEKNGMEFISFPIKDRGLPASVDKYIELTQNLYHQIAGGKNTLIHCRAGIGRTGMIAAGVLVHCGFEPEDAFEYISGKRGIQVPDTQEQKDWVVSNYRKIVSKSDVENWKN